MKFYRSMFVVLVGCFISGCASPYAQKFSENSDDFKIKQAVFGYLLEKHFWDDGDYSAIFVTGSNAEETALLHKFQNHNPPLKPSYRAMVRPNRTPIDKDTGQPAIILSVETSEPSGNAVEAVGRWYAGGIVSGVHVFTLKRNGGEWIIESAK